MNPADTNSIEDFIYFGKDLSISYNNSSIHELLKNIIIPSKNIFYDYKEELLDVAVTVPLTDKEYNKYLYNPRKLSYDLYGYTDMYFILMILNNICDVKDFTMKKIKLIRPADIDILGRIINAEDLFISKNRTYIKNKEV